MFAVFLIISKSRVLNLQIKLKKVYFLDMLNNAGTPKISVIIVTWNMRALVERCLESIDQYADQPYELFVVDNNSAEATRAFLKSYQPRNQWLVRYEIIFNDTNVGYSGALNQGLEKMAGQYALLLNPDTKLLEPSFSKMLEVADDLPKAGVVGFKILNPSGKTQWSISKLPTVGSQLKARLGLNRFKFNYDQAAEVEQINIAAALIPKKVFDVVGLWDPGYFLWFEENDFYIRARQAGFKIYYSPAVSVLQESQAGIKTIPFWKRQLIWEKSMFRYFRKHHGWLQAFVVVILDIPFMLIGLLLRELSAFK